jgi:type IX secretion system PorP/SprF family membrane protein
MNFETKVYHRCHLKHSTVKGFAIHRPLITTTPKRKLAFAGLILLSIICGMKIQAQDLHFSQFFNSPLLTNPANTGFIPEADYRLGANYRNQWSRIPIPYKTMSIWGDAQVFRNRFETGWVGLGGVIIRDVAGSGNLTSTKIYGSAAYHQMLGNTGLLTAGFNLGWANKRVDVTKFTFDEQWNGKFFDVSIPSTENFANTNVSYLDVQVGLNYAYFPSDNVYINGGVSVMHVNAPRETFFGGDNKLARRGTVFLNGIFKLNDQWILNPAAYYSLQAKSSDFVLGSSANYNLSGDGEQQLIAGLYFRVGDAAVPMLGYQWKFLKFTFTYDVTTSNLRNYNHYNGATEGALLYSGYYTTYTGDKHQSLCPKF